MPKVSTFTQFGTLITGDFVPAIKAVGDGTFLQVLVPAALFTNPGNQRVFGQSDGMVINGVPAITPQAETAIYIGTDGSQYQWFNSEWH